MVLLNQKIKDARIAYFNNLITTNKHNPRFLFKSIERLLHNSAYSMSPPSTGECEKFVSSFVDKINGIRSSIVPPSSPSPMTELFHTCPILLDQFSPITLSDLIDTVSHTRSSMCSLDIMPPKLFKEAISIIGPSLLAIVNQSLLSGSVPESFKVASVQPLLKKLHLDPSTLTNYRPISKLPFASKILKQLVCKQLLELVEENHIFDKYQSGFHQKHSTETALLRVTNDIHSQILIVRPW